MRTIRKDLERTLELSTNRITEFGYLYFETNEEGFITSANPNITTYLGYPINELIGHHFGLILTDNPKHTFTHAFQEVRDGSGPQHLTGVVMKDRDGVQWTVEGTIASVRSPNDGVNVIACMLRDSSERVRSEEALIKAKETAERELEIGREIQASFLPKELPEIDGWQIASYFQAARMVSGDFYDAFKLNTTKKVGLVVADVCDKGVGAALFMGLFRSLTRAFADQPNSLSWMDVLSDDAENEPEGNALGRRRSMLSAGTAALKSTVQQTNDYIAENHGETSMFATMFLGMLDPNSGQLMYINAGQHDALLLNPGGGLQRLSATGPAVGLMPDMSFRIESVTLRPGGMLLAYTDGLPDAMNSKRQFFGQDQIERIFNEAAGSAHEMVTKISSAVQEHMVGADPFDDVTFMVVQRAM
jgi:sigma-B regulation protein RsbU (phosphoserine phosphatase)